MAKTIMQPHLLLVEGDEEIRFFTALNHHLKITTIQIEQVGGKENFKTQIPAWVQAPRFADTVTALGMIRDADDNAKGAFDSLCYRLQQLNLPVPKVPGHFAKNEFLKTGILILPPQTAGTNRMLEDICLESVKNDPAIECVAQYFECLKTKNIALPNNKQAKASVHAFLASRDEPDRRLGEAAQKGYWNWEHPIFDKLKQFLRELSQ
jgi:hypothetical protein